MNSALMFSKASDEWSTPQAFFEALDAEFGFDVDVAATAENCWKEMYYGPDHDNPNRRDALEGPWAGPVCFMNPPYSRCRAFIRKAAQEAMRGATVVCLVPSRTDTRWWHSEVWDASTNQPRPGVEVRFVEGRLKFGNSANSAPFPSVIVVFRPPASPAPPCEPLQALADLEADMRAYVFWDRWKASIWLERLAAIRKALT